MPIHFGADSVGADSSAVSVSMVLIDFVLVHFVLRRLFILVLIYFDVGSHDAPFFAASDSSIRSS